MSDEQLSSEYTPTTIEECASIYNQYLHIIFEDIMTQSPTVVIFKNMISGMVWKDPFWAIDNHSTFIHNNMEVFATNDMKQIVNFIVNHEFKEQKNDWIDILNISSETADSMVDYIKRDITSIYQTHPQWSQDIVRGLFVTYITYLQLLQNN